VLDSEDAARRGEERRGAARRDAAVAAGLAGVLGAEALRVDGFLRVALLAGRVARRVVVDEARVAPPEVAFRAIRCTCLLRPSNRLKTRSMSACFALRRTCVSSCVIAVLSVFCPSLIVRSSCLRRSGGTRLSACRSAFLPAFTARPTSPVRLDRDDARFLVAMSKPPLSTPCGAHNAPR
jgi:hypothetical protein